MRILGVAAAPEPQQFIEGFPPRGARLFLCPDLEICRLAALTPDDEFVYQDERLQVITTSGYELVVVRVDFNCENSARVLTERFYEVQVPVVLFGPQVTAWGDNPPGWVRSRVCGDIVLVWDRIREDARQGRLLSCYSALQQPHYVVPKLIFPKPGMMNVNYQVVQFVRGCACPDRVRSLCPEFLYYGEQAAFRQKDEIIGEVLALPKKQIRLLDEDIARYPEYYYALFRILWRFRRHWTVNAGSRLFEYPQLVRMLAKAGVKIIYLNESFFDPWLEEALKSPAVAKQLYRRVKFLHARRILVGARITLPDSGVDYHRIAGLLVRTDLDFIETRFIDRNGRFVPVRYHPMVQTDEPAWIKSRFYAFDSLVDRFVRRPRRVGFYSTIWYLITYSLAYRQNFLEGLDRP
ncbi:MAG: hypothetical protein ABIK22_00040 [candidate division WOR-3 bacterium]